MGERKMPIKLNVKTLCLALFVGAGPTAALANCDLNYEVQPGDNLFTVAEELYGDKSLWTLIYDRNQDVLVGPSAVPGTSIFIPCRPGETAELVEAAPLAVNASPLQPTDAELNLLTGGHFAPFTGADLPGQGLITELVHGAMELAPSPVSYAVTWDDHWAKHLDPLQHAEFDMGFPWAKPDCEADTSHEMCTTFHFSDPLIVVPSMLFAKVGGDMSFTKDDDILGKTICRPETHHSYDLDRSDRRWITDGKITLVQADTPSQCLAMVANGEADAAALNLFVGADAVVEMNLRDTIEPLETALSEVSLHVIISKAHWRGTSHLYRVNAGVAKLKESGRFDEIVARHLELLQQRIQ
jgi:polar amino acid transport system substrate-binding protein